MERVFRNDYFDVDKFKNLLTTRYIGRNIVYKNETGTTMDDAKEGALKGEPAGTIYLTETQTKARGARNHKWDALSKGNLYYSIILHRNEPKSQKSVVERFDLESLSGLTLLKVLQKCGLSNLCLKWPNDLWINGHKLSGSLAEDVGFGAGENKDIYIYILGVGVNVNADVRRHPDLHLIATSVKCERSGQDLDREELLANYCNQLEVHLNYTDDEIYKEVMTHQLFKFGDKVKVQKVYDGGTFLATVEDIQKGWKVVLEDETGKKWTGTEEFSLRPVKTKSIYVYNGHLAVPWSAQLLMKTFNSMINTSKIAVESLNDSKYTEGHWKQDALMAVFGELDLTKMKSSDEFDAVVDFVKKGGSAFVVKSGAKIFYPNIQCGTDEGNMIDSQTHGSLISVKPPGLTEFDIYAASVGQPLSLFPEVTQGSEVWDHHDKNTKTDNASIAISKYGNGVCAIFGFNIEVTYADLHLLDVSNDDLENSLKDTVFNRDHLIHLIVSKVLKL